MYFKNDKIAESLTNKNKRMYQMTKISVALVSIAFIIAMFMTHYNGSLSSAILSLEDTQKNTYLFLGILSIWCKFFYFYFI